MERIRGASVEALRRVQAEGPLRQAGRYLAEELVATTGFVDCPVVSPEEFASRLARLIEDVARMGVDVPAEVLVSARDPKGRRHSRVLARALARAGYPADGPVHQAIMQEHTAIHATLRLAFEVVWDLKTFSSLGHIPGVDEGRSCYRVHGAFDKAPAVLASGIGGLFDAFVVLMRRAEDGPSGDVVGRCWGLVNHAGAMVSNAYWGAKVQHGAGIRPFQLALHQALLGGPEPDKLEFWKPVDYGFQAELKRARVYCNGDAVGAAFHESPDAPFEGVVVRTDFLRELFPPVAEPLPDTEEAPSPRHPFGGATPGSRRARAIRQLEAEWFRNSREPLPTLDVRAALRGEAFDLFVEENARWIVCQVRELAWTRFQNVSEAVDILEETGAVSQQALRLLEARRGDYSAVVDLDEEDLPAMDLAFRLQEDFWFLLGAVPDWGPALAAGVARRWAAQRALHDFAAFMASVDVNTVAFGVRDYACYCREEPL